MLLRIIKASIVLALMAATTSSVRAQLGQSQLTQAGAGMSSATTGGGGSATGLSSGGGGNSGQGTSTQGANANSNAAQQFIGGNATQAFVGGAREATNQQSMNRQFQAFQAAQTTTNNQSQQTGTPRQIRSVLRIGFPFPERSALQQSGRLASANSVSLSRFSLSRPELSGVNVNLNSEGVAVLTGTLPSMESSRLAANLVRLQPGVRKIDNQILVSR